MLRFLHSQAIEKSNPVTHFTRLRTPPGEPNLGMSRNTHATDSGIGVLPSKLGDSDISRVFQEVECS